MRSKLTTLASISDINTHLYPNAGLPNPLSPSGFDETPAITAAHVAALVNDGLLNLVGGCCGTTPEHIAAIRAAVKDMKPRVPEEVPSVTTYAGLDAFVVRPSSNLVMVGERTNITGLCKVSSSDHRQRP